MAYQIPDTRPGYAFQNPGVGGYIGQGVSDVIKTILEAQQARQRQQQIDQQGQYQQGELADRAAARRTAIEEKARLLGQQRVIGDALGRLSAPDTTPPGQADPHTGQSGEPSVASLALGEVLRTAPSELRTLILKEALPLIGQQEKDKAALRADRARQSYLNSLSPDLRHVEEQRYAAEESGLKNNPLLNEILADTYAKGVSPETLDKIRRTHNGKNGTPDWTGLGNSALVAQYLGELNARTDAKFREPPQPQLLYDQQGNGVWVRPGETHGTPIEGGLTRTPPSPFALRAKLVWPNMKIAVGQYDKEVAKGGPLGLGDIEALTAVFDDPASIRGKFANWAVAKGKLSPSAFKIGNAVWSAARAQIEMMGRGGQPGAITQQAKDYLLPDGQLYIHGALLGMQQLVGEGGPKGASPRADLRLP